MYYGSDSSYHILNDISSYIRTIETTGNTFIPTGTTIEISGVDWNNSNGEPGSVYKNGLFVGIHCSSSDTYTKTCINASRLCELGVDFDEAYNDYTGDTYMVKQVDGFISNEELSDGDARGMFSTMNINGLATTNVNNQLKYNFTYSYPNGFDGRLRNANINGFAYTQKSDDVNSIDYNKFRFGSRYSSTPNSNEYYNFNQSGGGYRSEE